MKRSRRPSSLPPPSDEQIAASAALVASLRAQIGRTGGWMPFVDYMQQVLYAPGLGYYSGGSHKFGAMGDFVTAPELGPRFAQCLAHTVAAVFDALPSAASRTLLELGPGSGQLACDLLAALARCGAVPDAYCVLELSGELRARQETTLREAQAAGRIPQLPLRWLEHLPQDFSGCIVANEVLDAIPVQAVQWDGAHWQQRGVVWDAAQDRFCWSSRSLPAALQADTDRLPSDLPAGYCTETQPAACGLIATLAQITRQGVLLAIDYGFPASEYYHPERNQGSLICHYRHHSHADPFWYPGINDLTTHLDFSALWRAGIAAGWELEGFTSQAAYLLDAGLLDSTGLESTSGAEASAAVIASAASPFAAFTLSQARAQEIHTLTSPAEMGELFKVLAFSKGIAPRDPLPGFGSEDRSNRL